MSDDMREIFVLCIPVNNLLVRQAASIEIG